MPKPEVERWSSHSTEVQKAARQLTERFFNQEANRRPRTHRHLKNNDNQWPMTDPKTFYIVAGRKIKGDRFSQGVLPDNTKEITLPQERVSLLDQFFKFPKKLLTNSFR